MKTLIDEAGERVKGVLSGERMRRSEGRRARRDEVRGSVQRDGFEGAETSDWIFGAFFLIFIIFALSPGVLLTIPPGRGGLFMSGNTSTVAAFVHAILLVALLNFL